MSDRNLLDEFQLQAIRDFTAAARELNEELDECSIEMVTLESLMTDLNEFWRQLRAQFEEEKQ